MKVSQDISCELSTYHRIYMKYFLTCIFPGKKKEYISYNLFFSFCFSIDKVPKITSPVLVIHGTEDEVIDFSHGLAIYERCPRKVEPLWVEGAGHNDVELYGQYLERLKQFISVDLAVNWHKDTEGNGAIEETLQQLRVEDLQVVTEIETLLWHMWKLEGNKMEVWSRNEDAQLISV